MEAVISQYSKQVSSIYVQLRHLSQNLDACYCLLDISTCCTCCLLATSDLTCVPSTWIYISFLAQLITITDFQWLEQKPWSHPWVFSFSHALLCIRQQIPKDLTAYISWTWPLGTTSSLSPGLFHPCPQSSFIMAILDNLKNLSQILWLLFSELCSGFPSHLEQKPKSWLWLKVYHTSIIFMTSTILVQPTWCHSSNIPHMFTYKVCIHCVPLDILTPSSTSF